MLPAAIGSAAGAALGAEVTGAGAVGGGCVSPAWCVALADGRTAFVKAAPPGAPANLLMEEARSLRRLFGTGTVRVPTVLGTGADGGGWLALEWLEPSAGNAAAWSDLGRSLARLHRCTAALHGWDSDNYIGPLPQANGSTSSWPEFWAERRLRPQLERARSRLDSGALNAFERLFDGLAERLAGADEDGPSLLHGDLWSGNVHMTAGGAALVDPSCSFGHREVDLAMADLFGGFPPDFFSAYTREWPLLPGAAARRPVYQLYYLLVHVNLFGSSYVGGTVRVLRDALGA